MSGAGIAIAERPAQESEETEELLARARAGDRDAFGEIYDRCQAQIRAYLLSRMRDAATVDDLMKQTFLAAWLALPRYESRGIPVEAWLKRIAHNKAADHYRRSRPSVPLEAIDVSGITEPRGVEEYALRL